MSRVFVAGATGAVGRPLVPLLVEAGVAAKPEVVVHQLTALGGKFDTRRFDRMFALTNRLRTEGTDHLLEAARAVGARRMVAQSFGNWNYARTGGPVKTEDDPLDPAPPPALDAPDARRDRASRARR